MWLTSTGSGSLTTAAQLQSTAGALTRFLGREDELARIEGLLERALNGAGQVLGIKGEAGVGKSRLMFEFTRAPHTQTWLVLEAPAVAYADRRRGVLPVDLAAGPGPSAASGLG